MKIDKRHWHIAPWYVRLGLRLFVNWWAKHGDSGYQFYGKVDGEKRRELVICEKSEIVRWLFRDAGYDVSEKDTNAIFNLGKWREEN